jgi:hypothetical protein
MIIKLANTTYAVLIPSAGRPEVLFDTLDNQRFLNRPSTFVGLHNTQWRDYWRVREAFGRVRFIRYDNPSGSTVVARENLRQAAVARGFQRYVCADDNTYYTETSLENLVRASFVYTPRPVVVGGMQGGLSADTKPSRFDEAYVKKSGHTVGGLRFYKKIGMMFWIFPHSLYSKAYYLPKGWMDPLGCMEDHSMALCLMKHLQFSNFVVCMDAPFKKKRFQPGGQGGPSERAAKIGLAWMRLGTLYPEFMSEVRMVWPYAKYYKLVEKLNERKS